MPGEPAIKEQWPVQGGAGSEEEGGDGGYLDSDEAFGAERGSDSESSIDSVHDSDVSSDEEDRYIEFEFLRGDEADPYEDDYRGRRPDGRMYVQWDQFERELYTLAPRVDLDAVAAKQDDATGTVGSMMKAFGENAWKKALQYTSNVKANATRLYSKTYRILAQRKIIEQSRVLTVQAAREEFRQYLTPWFACPTCVRTWAFKGQLEQHLREGCKTKHVRALTHGVYPTIRRDDDGDDESDGEPPVAPSDPAADTKGRGGGRGPEQPEAGVHIDLNVGDSPARSEDRRGSASSDNTSEHVSSEEDS
jgi:hypothetical protein